MTILITGGTGFIGKTLVETLVKNKQKVISLDKKHKKTNNTKNDYLIKINGNILDTKKLEKIFKKFKIKKVIHLAALAEVNPKNSFIEYEKVNIGGTVNLLDLSAKYKIKNFIFASSSTVYNGGKNKKLKESDSTDRPISIYGATKRSGEILCHTYHNLYDLPIVCLRFFSVYGPNGRKDMAIHKFVDAIENNKKIKIYGDGTATRDYVYIDDLAQGIFKAFKIKKGYHIINLGSGETTSLNRLVRLIEKKVGKKAKIRKIKTPKGYTKHTWANIKKAEKELNWHPQTNIEEGIDEFIKWYRLQKS